MLKKTIKNLLSLSGYDLIDKKKLASEDDFLYESKSRGGFSYEKVLPRATYAPWKDDRAFHDLYVQVKQNTLVDKYRCFELWELIRQSEEKLPQGDYLEVGVWKGGTGAVIAAGLQQLRSASHVYLADTFTGVVKASAKDTVYRGGEHNDTTAGTVNELMQKCGLRNYTLLTGVFPDQTAHEIPAGTKFKLCHIDVDTYQSALDVLNWVWGRLLVGGVVVFDDYGFDSCTGVTKLVNELCQKHDRFFIHNLNGHAVFIKLAAK